ncbi:MAG: hypothetical protein E3J47_05795 [Candidatus Stahlbacteria bacterium]|nr:MAG: hypothetical protein E3J47_05795 [Candidatus Stahlbacteria bacterium]
MLRSDTILGTKNREFFTDDCKIAYAILTQNYDHLPCGAPVMVAVKKQRTLACINVFPARASTICGYTWLPENILKFVDKTPLCETHKVKNIDEFDYSQFSTIIKSVKEHGGVSFISNKKAAGFSMMDSIKSIVREYKHSSLFHFNTYGNRFLSGKNDNLLSIISFFDFIHCIPLFNLKKVDGLGISFTQTLRKHSQLVGKQVNTFRVDIIVSNYSDNLFTIDGATIDQEYKVKNSLYKEIKSQIKNNLPIQKDNLKLKSKKQSRDKKDKEFHINYESGGEVPSQPIIEPVTSYPSHNHGVYITSTGNTANTTDY